MVSLFSVQVRPHLEFFVQGKFFDRESNCHDEVSRNQEGQKS